MNLIKDFADIIENLLIKETIKYDKTDITNDTVEHYLITRYLEVHERIIRTNIKYVVRKTSLFDESYKDLKNDEKEICDNIIISLTKGIDVNNYLSSKVLKHKFDTVLSCWGINHLHLQKRNSNNKYDFCVAAKILLIVIFHNKVILVDIIKHPNDKGWFHKRWLEAIDDIEPNYFLDIPFAIDVINEFTDDEIIENIEKRCKIFLKIKNKVIMPHFGCATLGNSINAVMKANRICNFLKQCEKYIIKNIDKYRSSVTNTTMQYNMRLGKRVSSLKFRLILEVNELYLYETQYLIKFPFCNIYNLLGFNIGECQ